MNKPDFLGEAVIVPHRARSPFVTIGRGVLRVDDHCLLLVTEEGNIEIPVAAVSAILIEPGVSVSHEAVKLAAEHGTLLVWVGEAGVRLYSAGLPGGRLAERLIRQAQMHTNNELRMGAARRLYRLMFAEDMPETRSFEKLRGFEGARVRKLYSEIASTHGIEWTGRDKADQSLSTALGIASSCLYGLVEAVILATGYSPAIGIVHSGDARSLVFDLADTVKFGTVVPAAFKVYAESPTDTRNRVRRECRDLFRVNNTAARLFENLYIIMGEHDVDCPPIE